jgi:hypothetical protein
MASAPDRGIDVGDSLREHPLPSREVDGGVLALPERELADLADLGAG